MGKNQLPLGAQQERHERIVELHKAGMSYAEITAETGVTDRTIHRVLSKAKLVTRGAPPRPHPQELWDEIERFLREEEAPYAAAHQIYGVSVKRLQERFPELGWRRSEAGRNQGEINRIMWTNRGQEAIRQLRRQGRL